MDLTSTTYPFPRPEPFGMPPAFAWIRQHDPVTRVRLVSGDTAWLVTRYEDVRDALTDERFSRSIGGPGAARVDTGFRAGQASPVFSFGSSISEPPGHTRWRRLVSKAFTHRQAEAMRPQIVQHTRDVLDGLDDRDGRFDLMADVAYQIPILVIADLLGIEVERRAEFTDLAARLTRRDLQTSFDDFGAALQGIGRYTAALIARKRRHRGDDLLSTLMSVQDEDESRLSNEELIATVVLLLMAGYESTAVQFGNAMYALFLHPEQLARLRSDPALIGNAVEELLRFAQLGTGFAVAKFATTDIDIGGQVIPAGSTVFVSLGSANRDESVFGADADDLDLARTSASRQLAFSHGPHYCLGAALARLELQIGITELLARYDPLQHDGDLRDVVLASNLFTYYPRELRVTARRTA